MKRLSAIRYANPALLALGLLCFCLPWIDVQCPRRAGSATASNDKLTLSQSGLQMVYGGYSAKMDGRPVADKDWLEREYLAGHPSFAAPMIAGYPLLLIGGLTVAIVLRRKRIPRTASAMAVSAAAVAVVIGQVSLGFPIVNGESLPFLSGWNFEPAFYLAILLPGIGVYASALELMVLSAHEKYRAAEPAPPDEQDANDDDWLLESPQRDRTVPPPSGNETSFKATRE